MNTDIKKAIKKNWDNMAKPLDSLGVLEDIVVKIGALQNTADNIDISKRALVIYCADHGAVCEGVSQTDNSVTKTVTENFEKGSSITNILASKASSDMFIIDIGMDTDHDPGKRLSAGKITDRKIRRGTRNIAVQNAMTEEECKKAMECGADIVHELASRGYKIIATGEMGIGNTTVSSVLTSKLLNIPAKETVGRGAGLSDERLENKIRVVQKALDRIKDMNDPMEILSAAGGFEAAGMAGTFLGAFKENIPVIIDGAISAAAALVAFKINPGVNDVLIASHVSKEKVSSLCLEALGLSPVISANLALGEGSGAMLLLPVIDTAVEIYKNMGSFSDYNIKSYKRYND